MAIFVFRVGRIRITFKDRAVVERQDFGYSLSVFFLKQSLSQDIVSSRLQISVGRTFSPYKLQVKNLRSKGRERESYGPEAALGSRA
jgi:hypothetical protein